MSTLQFVLKSSLSMDLFELNCAFDFDSTFLKSIIINHPIPLVVGCVNVHLVLSQRSHVYCLIREKSLFRVCCIKWPTYICVDQVLKEISNWVYLFQAWYIQYVCSSLRESVRIIIKFMYVRVIIKSKVGNSVLETIFSCTYESSATYE